MCIVYYLYSTKDNRPRYVGQTRRTAAARLDDHLRFAATGSKAALARWIRCNTEKGYEIRISVIDAAATWNDTERQVIADWRDKGIKLLNILDGGNDTIHHLIARKKSGRDRDRQAQALALAAQSVDAQSMRKPVKNKPPSLSSKKSEHRKWLYGKFGQASDVRSIPIPGKIED